MEMTPQELEKSRDLEKQRAERAEGKLNQTERSLRETKDMVQKLYGVIVRALVLLKYLLRIGAVGAIYMLLGRQDALILGFFFLVQGMLQLAIDKTRQVVHPDLKLSEWDIDF